MIPTLWVCLMPLSVIACGCVSHSADKRTDEAVVQETRAGTAAGKEFKISLSTGGGFTGLTRGYHLYADGRVEAWRRFASRKDTILAVVQADPSRLRLFQRRLEQSGLLQKTYRETGNMTTRLTYNLADTTYTWSWSGAGNGLAPEIKDWFVEVHNFCILLAEEKQ